MTEYSEESHILRLTERNRLIKRVSGLGGAERRKRARYRGNRVRKHVANSNMAFK